MKNFYGKIKIRGVDLTVAQDRIMIFDKDINDLKIGIAIKGAQNITQNNSSFGQYQCSSLREKALNNIKTNKKESAIMSINCL